MAEINSLSITAGNNVGRFPEGMPVSSINDGARELEAMIGRYSRDTDGSNVSSGTGTAYILTPYRTITSLTHGLLFAWRANIASADEPTIAIGGQTAKDLIDADGRKLTVGDISGGQVVVSIFNATRDAGNARG